MISSSLLSWLIHSRAWKQAAASLLISGNNHHYTAIFTTVWCKGKILQSTKLSVMISGQEIGNLKGFIRGKTVIDYIFPYASLDIVFSLLWHFNLVLYAKNCSVLYIHCMSHADGYSIEDLKCTSSSALNMKEGDWKWKMWRWLMLHLINRFVLLFGYFSENQTRTRLLLHITWNTLKD